MSLKSPSCSWYVAQTHPHGEERAVSNLRRQGFETYVPRYLRRRKHARKVEMIASVLFPRYVFVAFNPLVHRWLSIRSTSGISLLITQGDTPLPVPAGVVEGLRGREGEDGLITLGMGPSFVPGDKVRVVGGAFDEALGLFETINDAERVTILLDLLGRKVRVVLGVDQVVAA